MSRFAGLTVLAALTLAVAGCSTSKTLSSGPRGAEITTLTPPPYVPGPLSGERTARADALRRPVAVMVENYAPDSRPQVGLSAASLVFETLAEGGVTRFMAVYLERGAPQVGPVRSTRVYFNNWASAFHSILVHVGGNDDAQNELWTLHDVFNVDENKWEISLADTGTPLFWRSADRMAPHNMYVSIPRIRQYAATHHENWAYSNASIPHKSGSPLSQRGHASSIDIQFVDPLAPNANQAYSVNYTYNRQTNTYARSMGGAPHFDPAYRKVLAPANVVIMKTGSASPDPNAGLTPESILIPVVGSGEADYFRDGHTISGHWQQKNTFAPLTFYDRRWHPVAFNPGQTWVEVVPAGSSVTWSDH